MEAKSTDMLKEKTELLKIYFVFESIIFYFLTKTLSSYLKPSRQGYMEKLTRTPVTLIIPIYSDLFAE